MTETCPFCEVDDSRIVDRTELTLTILDAFPVSPGHTLVVPKRHVSSFFEATTAERNALLGALESARADLMAVYRPDGFNIGINEGVAAGQTVIHLHIHLIPRYQGDATDPRGGVRGVIPARQKY